MEKKLAVVLAASVAVLGFGVAAAQPDDEPPVVELKAQRDVTLTPQQMLQQGAQILPFMTSTARTVRERLRTARKERDVVKVLCLSDKSSQIDVAIRSATDRVELLKSAVRGEDLDGARHEFMVLGVLRDRVQTLLTEANQCIGEETGFIGESEVKVEIDPSIPDEDPSEYPDDPLVTDPPVLRSPTY